MFSVYTHKMSVIPNGGIKYSRTKTNPKGKKSAKESLQRAKKTPGKIPGSKSSNDILIVDDVDNEVLNLPDLAFDKRCNSDLRGAVKHESRNTNFQDVAKADCSVRKSLDGDKIVDSSNKRATEKRDGLQSRHVNKHVTSKQKPGAKRGRSDLLLDSSSLKAVHGDNISIPLAGEHRKPVHIPRVASRLHDCVSVSDVLPGRVEQTHIEVLTKTAYPKRKDSLILPDAIPGTSYAFEEKNGSLNDSLTIQREFSKRSLISNRSTDSKKRNSVVQIPQNDREEEDKPTVGANESLIQSAIPNLPPGQAILCLVLNVLVPGTGIWSSSPYLFISSLY